MNIETKTIRIDFNLSEYGEEEDHNRYLKQITAFGWQFTQQQAQQDGRCLNHYNVYARDRNMPHYLELVRLEQQYEAQRQQLERYEKMDGVNAMIAFLILIIPGVIYVTFKMVQKSRIRERNEATRAEMDKIVGQALVLRKK